VEQFLIDGTLHPPKLRMRYDQAAAADQRDARDAKTIVRCHDPL
jgi:hypothetical protein